MKIRRLCEELGIPLSSIKSSQYDDIGIHISFYTSENINLDIEYDIYSDFYNIKIFSNESKLLSEYYKIRNESCWESILERLNYKTEDLKNTFVQLKRIIQNGIMFEIMNYNDDVIEYNLFTPVYVLEQLRDKGVDEYVIRLKKDNQYLKVCVLYVDEFKKGNILNNGLKLTEDIHFKNKEHLKNYYSNHSNLEKFFDGVFVGEIFFDSYDLFTEQIKNL